jgi:hypothetical protein
MGRLWQIVVKKVGREDELPVTEWNRDVGRVVLASSVPAAGARQLFDVSP